MKIEDIRIFRANKTDQYAEERERAKEIIDKYFVEMCEVAEVLQKNEGATRVETPFGYYQFFPAIKHD